MLMFFTLKVKESVSRFSDEIKRDRYRFNVGKLMG